MDIDIELERYRAIKRSMLGVVYQDRTLQGVFDDFLDELDNILASLERISDQEQKKIPQKEMEVLMILKDFKFALRGIDFDNAKKQMKYSRLRGYIDSLIGMIEE
jgi:molecular chaperone GrpE (heat shock protein)